MKYLIVLLFIIPKVIYSQDDILQQHDSLYAEKTSIEVRELVVRIENFIQNLYSTKNKNLPKNITLIKSTKRHGGKIFEIKTNKGNVPVFILVELSFWAVYTHSKKQNTITIFKDNQGPIAGFITIFDNKEFLGPKISKSFSLLTLTSFQKMHIDIISHNTEIIRNAIMSSGL